MKIRDIKYESYMLELPRKGGQPGFPTESGKRPYPLLRILTDDGVEGFCFTRKEISETTLSRMKQWIVGKDPFDREWIWQTFWNAPNWGRVFGTAGRATLGDLAAIDIALWDLAGKVAGLPIYKLLGAYRDKIKVYASSYRMLTPEDYAQDALAAKERGITAYKLHVSDEIAIEACKAVRKAVGDDMKLMLDGGTGNNRDQALRVGKVLEELNFHWFEEPVLDSDIDGLVMLRQKLRVPICATECVTNSMFSIPEYLVRGAVDIARADTLISGGITPCKKIADMCNAFGVQCEIHSGGIPNLHVECAIKNCEFYEYFWPRVSNFGLKEFPVLDKEGCLHVPQKPGLGVEIDWEALGKPIVSY